MLSRVFPILLNLELSNKFNKLLDLKLLTITYVGKSKEIEINSETVDRYPEGYYLYTGTFSEDLTKSRSRKLIIYNFFRGINTISNLVGIVTLSHFPSVLSASFRNIREK